MAAKDTTDTVEDNKSITEDTDQNTFDTSKLGDEEFAKFFDDPRAFRHPRFKSLNDRARKATEYEKQEEQRQADLLKEQGKWEALATHEKERAERAEAKAKEAYIENRVQMAATKFGAVDVETVLRLIDTKSLTTDDNGNVLGVDEAVEKLLQEKPFLKKGNTVNLGNPTAPGNTGAKKFKLSQTQDRAFYLANEKEIREAFHTGNVENDR